MKKKIILVTTLLMLSLTGCQALTKDLGGSTTIKLEPNHTFQQQTDFGVFEGTVTIIETKDKSN